MKKTIKLVLAIVVFMLITLIPSTKALENDIIDIYIFYSLDCPHCKDAREFLKQYKQQEKQVSVHYYEVNHNEKNARLLEKVQKIYDESSLGVPYMIIGSNIIIGFNESTELEIKETIKHYKEYEYTDITGKIINDEITKENIKEYLDKDSLMQENIKIPLIGKINVKEASIPLIAVVIGLVDGFNPCAMWVLIFLISMLINMKDRKKMWALGVSFILTSAIVYALIMGAWLKVIVNFAGIRWIQAIIGIVALIGSFINFRSFYNERKKESGCQVVDEKKRKKIINSIKKFTTEKSFLLALLGVIALSISVNVVELACSAGLPVLFTNILAINNITGIKAILYISLYILFFLLDDLIVFIVAAITFKVTGITTKYTKISHLIGAIIMFLIGILLIIKPEWIMFNF